MFAPFVRTIDLWGTFRKHVLAPRCKSQADMNLQFQGMLLTLTYFLFACETIMLSNGIDIFLCNEGTFYFLAERYTVSLILRALHSVRKRCP